MLLEPADFRRNERSVVAGLLYDADPSFNEIVYGERAEAVERIAALLGKKDSFFAPPNLRCVFQDGKTVGVLAGYEVKEARRVEWAVGGAFLRGYGWFGFLRRIPTWLRLNRILGGTMEAAGYYVVYACVSESRRNQGIGKAMFDELMQDHDDLYLHVNADNTAAIRFYERLGFVKAGSGQGRIRGRRLSAYLMHRHRPSLPNL